MAGKLHEFYSTFARFDLDRRLELNRRGLQMRLVCSVAKWRYGFDKGRSRFHEGSQKAAQFMPAKEILLEATKLRKISDNLDILADQHVPVTEALSILSGSVRNSATLLEILVALRLGALPEIDPSLN